MSNRIETGLRIKGLSGDTNALYVLGNSFINGDVNITGNVNVIGTATTLNTQTVQTKDNRILLNYSGTNLTAIGGGIEVLSAKTDGTNVSLTTDSNGYWNSNTGLNITGKTYISQSLGVGTSPISQGIILGNTQPIYFGFVNHYIYNSGDTLFVNGWNHLSLNSSQDLTFKTNNINSFFIDSNQNIGVNLTGTTTDSSKLHIKGSDSSSSNYGLKVQNSGGTNNFVVRNDGNVGIGTSNPNAKLDVVGNMTVSGTSPTNVRVRIGSGTAHLGDVYGANLAAVNNNGNGSIEVSTDLTGGTASLSLSTSFVNQVGITKFGPNYAGSLDGILNANSLHIRNTTYSAYGNVLFPNQHHYFIGKNYADTYIGDYGIRHSSKSTITSGPNGEIQFYKAAGSNDGNGFSRRTMVIGDYTNVGGTSGIGDLLTIENNATYTASTFQYRSGAVVHINDMTPYTAVTGNIFKVTKSNVEVLSLSASGNLGVNQSNPSEKLDVNGKTKTTTLQVTSGSPQVGYVLTATDTSGNMTWQAPTGGGGGGTFTGGTVAGGTNFTGGLSANTFTLNGVTYTSFEENVKQGTGLTIHFSGKTIFNLPTSPASGNITQNLTNAKLGMIQKIYHSGSTVPTVPTEWQLVGEGTYFTYDLNIIYAEYVTNNWIEYWIIQKQI